MKSPYRSPTTLTHTHTHSDEVKALSRPTLHLFTNIDYFYNESHSRRKSEERVGGKRRETAVIDIDAVALAGTSDLLLEWKKTHTSILVRFRFEVALFLPPYPSHNCFDMQL